MNEETASPSNNSATPKPAKPIRTWPLWSIAIIALILALGAGAGGWYLWQGQQALQSQNQHLVQRLDSLENQASQNHQGLDQRLQHLRKTLDQQGQTLARQHREIDHNAQALLNAGHRSHTDWLLAEAEYLLRIANQRLQVEQDYRGALHLLQQADKVLSRTDDPGVFAVRRALAHEEMALRNVQSVDRTGLYLKLEAALDNVHNLSQSALMQTEQQNRSRSDGGSPATQHQGKTGNDTWHRILASLKHVIVIRRLDQPVKPLPAPKQSAYLQLDLRLRLQQAETALLRGDARVYQTALKQALDELNHWFDDSNAKVAALKSSLQSLASDNINPQLPDISKSLHLLKARIAGRDQSSEAPSKADKDKHQGGQQ